MKEPTVRLQQPIVASHQAPEVAQPADRALHNPAVPVPSQLAPVLVRRLLVVGPRRNDRLNPSANHQGPGSIAVIATVREQPIRPLPRAPYRNRVERRVEEPDLRPGRRVQACFQRNTRAIDQYHPLCPLATIGRPDFGAPFFAGAKLPSIKHSFQRSFCWSLIWASEGRHRSSSTPTGFPLPPPTGTGAALPPEELAPRSPSPQNPEHPFEAAPIVGRRLAAAGGRWGRIWSHWTPVKWRQAMRPPFTKVRHGADSPPFQRF